MRFTYTCFFILCFYGLQAQDWQTVYKQSSSAFRNQNFEEALALSEKALQLSDADAKSKAFTLQIITASSLELNKPEVGLKYIHEELELFGKIEPTGKNYADAFIKKGKLLFMASKPSEAAAIFSDALIAVEKAYGEKNYDYYLVLLNQGQALVISEKYKDAQKNFEACEKAFPSFEDAGEDYLYTLYYFGVTGVKLSQADIVQTKLTAFINLLEKNGLTSWPEYNEAKNLLKSPSTNSGDANSSKQLSSLLKRAVEIQNTNPNEAKSLYESCEKIIAQYNIADGLALSSFINQANVLCRLREFQKAAEKLSISKNIAAKLLAPEAMEYGYIQKTEALILSQSGKPEQALPLYETAVRTFKNANPNIRFVQVREIARELSSYHTDKSFLILEEGLADSDFAKLNSSDQIEFLRLYASLSIEHQRGSQLASVLQSNEAKFASAETKQAYLLYKGIALGNQGNFNKSIESLKSAIAVNPESPVISEAYYEMARYEQKAGNFKNAEEYYQKAIKMLKHEDDQLVNQIYNSFATFYLGLGNYAGAEKVLTKLLAVDHQPSLFYNTVKQNLSAIYQQTGRYKEAKHILIEVLKTEEREFGKVRAEYTVTLQNLALVYQKLNKVDSALLLMSEALALDKQIYGEENLVYATKMANLGALYQDVQNFSKAKEFYENALRIRKKFLPPQHPDYAFNVYNLAYLFYRTQNRSQALPLFRETASYYLKQIKEVFPALSDYERTMFYNKVRPVIYSTESFLTENSSLDENIPGELLNFRLETKALLLNSSMKTRNTILNSGNESLITEFKTWLHTKEQLAFLYSLNINDQKKHLKLIDEYESKANALEKSLSVQSDAFAKTFERATADWKKIQAKLKPDEAAVEIIRVNLPKKDSITYAALVFKSIGNPKLIVLPSRKTETRDFNGYRNSVQFILEDTISYNIYWKKIDRLLAGAKTVYLSPDGVYNKVNCLTLFDQSTHKFIIDKYNIQLVTNLKELIDRTPSQPPAGKNAVLLGSPDFRLGLTTSIKNIPTTSGDGETFFELLHGGLTDLPGTETEITKISEILTRKNWNVRVETHEKASEDLMKTLSPEILHIATHGFFISAKEKSDQVNDASLSNIRSNVMLRSGILLAGAEKFIVDKLQGNSSETKREDGVLTALEVMNLSLDKTSLVVLSACETASGDVRNGEGVYGLQRAFLLAGAKSLIMSLWKVDDNATQELMVNFYNRWMNGDPKAIAFQKAQQDLKTKFPQPYFWGAFVLVGNN